MASVGFDTACRMTLDVVMRDGEDMSLVMPICCFYNIRDSRRRMQERSGGVGRWALDSDVGVLVGAEGKYHEVWVF